MWKSILLSAFPESLHLFLRKVLETLIRWVADRLVLLLQDAQARTASPSEAASACETSKSDVLQHHDICRTIYDTIDLMIFSGLSPYPQ